MEWGGGKGRLVGLRWLWLEGRVEEGVVVGFTAEWAAQSDGEWGDVDVEEALVGPVGGGAGPK